ncbi:MAG: hypothetical protein M1607_01055 [Patescibacteria group bacterium]|nr:hypothetical protein [Patescibacteria group bacterium]
MTAETVSEWSKAQAFRDESLAGVHIYVGKFHYLDSKEGLEGLLATRGALFPYFQIPLSAERVGYKPTDIISLEKDLASEEAGGVEGAIKTMMAYRNLRVLGCDPAGASDGNVYDKLPFRVNDIVKFRDNEKTQIVSFVATGGSSQAGALAERRVLLAVARPPRSKILSKSPKFDERLATARDNLTLIETGVRRLNDNLRNAFYATDELGKRHATFWITALNFARWKKQALADFAPFKEA